jgi:hypothetical protein
VSTTIPKPWQRSTKRRPCAVCHGAGCLYTGPHNAPVAVVCAQVENGRRIGKVGFLHVISDNGGAWSAWRCSLPKLAKLEAHRG